MIKQEPLDYSAVEAQTSFFPPSLYDVQPLLDEDYLLGEFFLDDNEEDWSMCRPHAPGVADAGHVGDEFVPLVPLEIKHEPSLDDAQKESTGLLSPAATSDFARFDSPHQDMAAWLPLPVLPPWGDTGLHGTMAMMAPQPLPLEPVPFTPQPLSPQLLLPLPLMLPMRELQRPCSTRGCRQAADGTQGDGDRCPRHAGGRLCNVPGCTKKTQTYGRCMRHGGGRRCDVADCLRGAQSGGKCKRHGGGVRCKAPGCTRGAQGSGLCRTHGGGKLCAFPGCTKSTQRHGKCSTHGGARRCRVDGCEMSDRGSGFCVRHKMEADESETRQAAATPHGDVHIKTEHTALV